MKLFLMLLVIAAQKPISLDVTPHVLFAGREVRITCRVMRNALNREVQWGFENYLSDTRQLDGEDSRITWEAWFPHMPCDPGRAFCQVKRADSTYGYVSQNVEVAGCEP